jgi:hypothetical protein
LEVGLAPTSDNQNLASPCGLAIFICVIVSVLCFVRSRISFLRHQTVLYPQLPPMTSITHRNYSPVEIANWDGAVARYNQVINANAEIRVSHMGEEDLRRYSDRYNTASASREDVLGHMFRWGGFRDLIISGGLTNNESALFARLLSGKEPLPHSPPRYFKQPWYELFDRPDACFECAVKPKGMSTRKRDAGRNVFVFEVNDCPWECVSMSDSAQRLLAIDAQWARDSDAARSDLWLEARDLLQRDVSLQLTFGRWETPFRLWLDSREDRSGLGTALSEYPQPSTDSVFGFPFEAADFPARWLISR